MSRNGLFTRALCLGLCTLAATFAVGSAQAATLSIAGGKVVGASGLTVNDKTYSVSFVDGTCTDLFSDCNGSNDFDFSTLAEANAASTALKAALDGYNPAQISGCTSSTDCFIWTPYQLFNSSTVQASLVVLLGGGALALGSGSTGILTNFGASNTADGIENVWAQWTPTPVPLPAAAWLFISALGSLVLVGRRRRMCAASA